MLDGITRMNGGFSSRVALGVRPGGNRPGESFVRDTRRILASRAGIAEDSGLAGDIGLVWLEKWDGKGQIDFAALDPYYIEICRQVRLIRRPDGSIGAVLSTSKGTRISAGKNGQKGRTGDPWAPIHADGTQSWGIGAEGFGYGQLAKLLDPAKITLPRLAKVDDDGGSQIALYANAVTRGQGKTEGFHERLVPIPRKVADFLARPDGFDRIGEVARGRLDSAGTAQRIFSHALFMLYQSGPERDEIDFKDKVTKDRVRPWTRRLDALIDASFFDDAFWDEVVAGEASDDVRERYELAWRRKLRTLAGAVLEEAMKAAPRTEMARLRARARCKGVFEGRMHGFVEPAAALDDFLDDSD